jgi:MerR family transcriptional regulator, heat shock protein HspR
VTTRRIPGSGAVPGSPVNPGTSPGTATTPGEVPTAGYLIFESAPGSARPVDPVRDGFELDAPLFVISVAAQLAGMHAQTLRSYDREGLVSPGRTSGGGRRYSRRDIELLREVQKLSQDDGVNRAGIRRIIELEAQVDALRARLSELSGEIRSLHADLNQSQADAANAAANAIAGLRRDVVPWQNTTTAMVTWRPHRRRV